MGVSSVFLLLLAILAALHLVKDLISRYSHYRTSLQLMENCPGLRVLVHPDHWSSRWLPRIPGVNLGAGYLAEQRHEFFTSRGNTDVLSLVSFFPPRRTFIVGDPVSARTVLLDGARFLERGGRNGAQDEEFIGVTRTGGRTTPMLHGWNDLELNAEAVEAATTAVDEVLEQGIACKSPEGKQGGETMVVPDLVEFALAIQLRILAHLAFSNLSATELPLGALREGLAADLNSSHSFLAKPCQRIFSSSPNPQASTELEHLIKVSINSYHSASTSSPKGKEKASQHDLISALLETSVEQELMLDDLASLDSSVLDDPRLSDSEVLQTVLRMLRGSYESLGYALSATLLLLALYPEAQAQIHAELDQVAPLGGNLTMRTLESLPYLNATLMETTRLYPPIVALTRISTVDTVLPTSPAPTGGPCENVFIPRGSELLIDLAALHRNPRYWGQSCDEFDPERFLNGDKDQSAAPVDAFMGFGSGRLGEEFASIGILALLASIMRKFTVELREPVSQSDGRVCKAVADSVVGATTTSAMLLRPSAVGMILRERVKKS